MNDIKLEYVGPDVNYNPTDASNLALGQGGMANHSELDLGQPSGVPPSFSAPVSNVIGNYTVGGPDRLQLLVAIIGLVMLFLALVHFSGDSEDFSENFDSFLSEWIGEEELVFKTPKKGMKAKPAVVAEVVEEVTVPSEELVDNSEELIYNDDMFANPYWYLPNKLSPHPAPMINKMSGSDEEFYRNGLNHEYVYQAYAAIQNLRRSRLSGAEVVLYDAINHRKFWTRMEASIALAEFGFEVSKETIDGVFEGVRPSLIKNYLKRLRKRPSPGAIYILRQAIKLLDGPGRLQVLKILSLQHFKSSRLYLAAATFDPSYLVQEWLNNELGVHSLSGEDLRVYRETIARSYRDGDDALENETEVAAPTIAIEDDAADKDVKFFVGEALDAIRVEDEDEPVFDGEVENAGKPTNDDDDGFDDINGFSVEEGYEEEDDF